MTGIPFAEAPLPQGQPRFVRLVSPKVGQDERVVSHSSRLYGIWTHWLCGRTHPCLSPVLPCPGCAEFNPRRWKGYLAGWSYTHHCRCLAEFPADTVRATVSLRDPGVSLRGAALLMRRIGPNPNSCVVARVTLSAEAIRTSDPDPDVPALLCRLWGVEIPAAHHQPRQLGDGGGEAAHVALD